MFDLDRWQEIVSSIRTNLLRTVLSGFTVVLGLFIFIVLFGLGNGLRNMFESEFTRDAQNYILINTGLTSLPYKGLEARRAITLHNKDLSYLKATEKKNIEHSSPVNDALWMVKYLNEGNNYNIKGINDEELYIKNKKVITGRYLSPIDIKEKRNVAVIGRLIQKDLIKNGNPIGKQLDINGSMFKVIGVFSSDGGDWEEREISIPYTTMQQLKKGSDTIGAIQLTYDAHLNTSEAIAFGEHLEKKIKALKKVSPDDEQAVDVYNNAKNLEDSFLFLAVLTAIVGFIGIGTLLAGIIGISNIMIFIIKERTQEIGVRKALGAKPSSIVGLVIQESIFITVLSGIAGIAMGVQCLHLIGDHLEKYFIHYPSVSWKLIAVAFIALVVAGGIAGFIPARRASRIKPIEALRTE